MANPFRHSAFGRALGLALLLSLALSSIAGAHGRSVSYSSWEIGPESAEVSVRLRLLEVSRFGPEALPTDLGAGIDEPALGGGIIDRFAEDVILVADGERCATVRLPESRPDEPGWVRVDWRVECPTAGAQELFIRSRLLLSVAPSHMHFARVRFDGAPGVFERVLTEASPDFDLHGPSKRADGDADGSGIGSDFTDYVALGVEHILSGWDHLAFVFGLLLLASRMGEVARLVTGFTVAHSLTLALAVEGLIHPRAAAVEAIIAFSVALVAIEKGWLTAGRGRIVPGVVLAGIAFLGLCSLLGWTALPMLTIVGLLLFTACYFALASRSRSEWLRFCLTFTFGLVHGLGFAGILMQMTLPTDRLAPALIGFNVGVEIGQIGVVLLLWPLLVLGARVAPKRIHVLASEVSAAGLCGLGLYWLIERAFTL